MGITVYLTFGGTCQDAMSFYGEALGVTPRFYPFAGTPAEADVAPEWRDKMMHAGLTYQDTLFMASDWMGPGEISYSGFSVSLNTASIEEAERLFAALAAGGTVTMPIAETFWALRFGMFTDKFGVPWMINCDRPEAA